MVTSAEVLRILSRPIARSEAGVSALVRDGLPVSVVRALADTYAVTSKRVGEILGIAGSTSHRRKQLDRPLKATDSDRAFRMAKVFAVARNVFEDGAKAQRWFGKANRVLDGGTPLSLHDGDARCGGRPAGRQ